MQLNLIKFSMKSMMKLASFAGKYTISVARLSPVTEIKGLDCILFFRLLSLYLYLFGFFPSLPYFIYILLCLPLVWQPACIKVTALSSLCHTALTFEVLCFDVKQAAHDSPLPLFLNCLMCQCRLGDSPKGLNVNI